MASTGWYQKLTMKSGWHGTFLQKLINSFKSGKGCPANVPLVWFSIKRPIILPLSLKLRVLRKTFIERVYLNDMSNTDEKVDCMELTTSLVPRGGWARD